MNNQMILTNTGIELAGLGSGIESIDVIPHFTGGQQMRVALDNGYGLSVLSGGFGVYTKGGTFEVAIVLNDGGIVSPLEEDGDGVYGYLSHAEVADILRRVSYLPKVGTRLKA